MPTYRGPVRLDYSAINGFYLYADIAFTTDFVKPFDTPGGTTLYIRPNVPFYVDLPVMDVSTGHGDGRGAVVHQVRMWTQLKGSNERVYLQRNDGQLSGLRGGFGDFFSSERNNSDSSGPAPGPARRPQSDTAMYGFDFEIKDAPGTPGGSSAVLTATFPVVYASTPSPTGQPAYGALSGQRRYGRVAFGARRESR